MIMTQDKARKTATRQRMAATGEPYCEARRAAGAEADPGGEGPTATPPTPREEDWYARMAEEAGLSDGDLVDVAEQDRESDRGDRIDRGVGAGLRERRVAGQVRERAERDDDRAKDR